MSAHGSLLLDTSAAVAHLRGVGAVTQRMQACLEAGDTLYLPLTAWGELLYGAYRSEKPERELANLAQFSKVVLRLYPSDQTADTYARIKQKLANAGSLIPENDVWIAAFALEHALPIATRDEHFSRVIGLKVLDWR